MPAGQRFPKRDPSIDRRCEVCSVPIPHYHSLCRKHQVRRDTFGHVKLRGLPIFGPSPRGQGRGRGRPEWKDLLPLTKAYLRKNPPSQEVVSKLREIIEPGVPPPPTMRATHPRAILYRLR